MQNRNPTERQQQQEVACVQAAWASPEEEAPE